MFTHVGTVPIKVWQIHPKYWQILDSGDSSILDVCCVIEVKSTSISIKISLKAIYQLRKAWNSLQCRPCMHITSCSAMQQPRLHWNWHRTLTTVKRPFDIIWTKNAFEIYHTIQRPYQYLNIWGIWATLQLRHLWACECVSVLSNPVSAGSEFNQCVPLFLYFTESLGPTSAWGPFGHLDFVICTLWALRLSE